jgi:hypothetical protein
MLLLVAAPFSVASTRNSALWNSALLLRREFGSPIKQPIFAARIDPDHFSDHYQMVYFSEVRDFGMPMSRAGHPGVTGVDEDRQRRPHEAKSRLIIVLQLKSSGRY